MTDTTEREAIIRAAIKAIPGINPLCAEDLLGGFTMCTEADDIVAIWQAARASQAAPLPVAEGWRPIATAPRSIQPLLVYNENGRHSIETGHYVHNMMHAAKIDGEGCFYTHWMPLPAPPQSSHKEGDKP